MEAVTTKPGGGAHLSICGTEIAGVRIWQLVINGSALVV
jgi:hypothetical protein